MAFNHGNMVCCAFRSSGSHISSDWVCPLTYHACQNRTTKCLWIPHQRKAILKLKKMYWPSAHNTGVFHNWNMDAPYCLSWSAVFVHWPLLHTVSGPGGDPQTPMSPEMEPRPEWNQDQCTARMDPKTYILLMTQHWVQIVYIQASQKHWCIGAASSPFPPSASPYHSSPHLPTLSPPDPYHPFLPLSSPFISHFLPSSSQPLSPLTPSLHKP